MVNENDSIPFFEQLDGLDTLGAYISTSAYELARVKVEKSFNLRRIHIMKETFYFSLWSYNFSSDFPFFERVNGIIHRLTQSGLMERWTVEDTISYERPYIELCRKFLMKNNDNAIDSNEFPKFIVYGWLASVAVFLFELCWKKLECSCFRRGKSSTLKVKNTKSRKRKALRRKC